MASKIIYMRKLLEGVVNIAEIGCGTQKQTRDPKFRNHVIALNRKIISCVYKMLHIIKLGLSDAFFGKKVKVLILNSKLF
jgi:hypothetical protein